MKLVAYLSFPGNTEEVLNFYKDLFGGEITYLQRYEDAPPDMKVSEGYKKKILHAQLDFGDNTMYFSDMFEGMPMEPGGNIGLNINFDDPGQLEEVYNRLKDKGTVTMELQDTFCNAKFAALTDQFGTGWSLNYSKPQDQ